MDTTKKDEIFSSPSQIPRQAAAGPSKKSTGLKPRLSSGGGIMDPDLEKQILMTLKKTPKEVTTIEGRVNIVSQM